MGGAKKMSANLALFKNQQEHFKEELKKYDQSIWFPTLRGSFEKDNHNNWFISFVPGSWGRWKGAFYGVHFDLKYAVAKGSLPEGLRLCIGVEKPLKYSYRQSFKENVISRVSKRGITQSGFVLRAKERTKLLEVDPRIPFNTQSWQIILERYIKLQSVVIVIAEALKDYYNRGAFDGEMLW
jgi:hypothetical protein